MTNPSRSAFDRWLAEAEAPTRSQPPAEELLGEHHVMLVVVAVMESEAERMLRGGALRPELWSAAVDFNGNFVHNCHRVKEEDFLVPALATHGLVDPEVERAVRKEHASGKVLTLSLIEGVEEDDWEKVLRLVSLYTHILRPHMRHEEVSLFARAAELPPDALETLRGDFDAVERRALADRGRRDIVAIARRLADSTGVPHDLPAA